MSEFPISAKVEAKVGERSVDKLIDAVVDTFSPATEFLGALGDSVRLGRIEMAAHITRRAKEIGHANGLVLTTPPLKFLAPFYEKASLESDDERLIEMWANLLVTAGSSGADTEIGFVQILSNLSRREALLLSALFDEKCYKNLDKNIAYWEIPENIDLKSMKFRLGVLRGLSFRDAVKKIRSEFDLPGVIVFSAIVKCEDDDMLCYGFESGIWGIKSNFNPHEDVRGVDSVVLPIEMMLSKGLLKEFEFEISLAEGDGTISGYVASWLAWEFMCAVDGVNVTVR